LAGLFSEIRRRKVLQGAVAYAVAGWLIIQVAVTLKSALDLPARVDTWVTIAVIAGFPAVVVLAWLFDFSLAGIRLTSPAAPRSAVCAGLGVARQCQFLFARAQ